MSKEMIDLDVKCNPFDNHDDNKRINEEYEVVVKFETKNKSVKLSESDFNTINNKFKKNGVWAMFGKPRDKEYWICLQVAQKATKDLDRAVAYEIISDLKLMMIKEDACVNCKETIDEDRAFYKGVYKRNLCEQCEGCTKHDMSQKRFHLQRNAYSEKVLKRLSRNFAIYQKIKWECEEILIIYLGESEQSQEEKKCDEIINYRKRVKEIEKTFAEKYSAKYFAY